jgi:hypothetical protein
MATAAEVSPATKVRRSTLDLPDSQAISDQAGADCILPGR